MARTDESFSGNCDANGVGQLVFRTYGRSTYIVEQVSHNGQIEGAVGVGPSATAGLFKNGRLVSRTVAQGGTVAGDPPVTIRGNDVLTLEYRACVPFASIEMTVFYDDGIQ